MKSFVFKNVKFIKVDYRTFAPNGVLFCSTKDCKELYIISKADISGGTKSCKRKSLCLFSIPVRNPAGGTNKLIYPKISYECGNPYTINILYYKDLCWYNNIEDFLKLKKKISILL